MSLAELAGLQHSLGKIGNGSHLIHCGNPSVFVFVCLCLCVCVCAQQGVCVHMCSRCASLYVCVSNAPVFLKGKSSLLSTGEGRVYWHVGDAPPSGEQLWSKDV